MYKCIIFDLDGTLFDTSDGIIKALDETISNLGYHELSINEKMTFIGPPISHSLKRVYNVSEAEAQNGLNIFREIYEEKYLYNAQLYPKIIELLDLLLSKNIYMTIATYKREDMAEKIIKYFSLDKYFNTINGSDINNTFTKADIIKKSIPNNKFNKNDILMIGDTISDYNAAKEVGIDFIGVNYGFGFKKNEATILDRLYNVEDIITLISGDYICS